jgi:hypothetical protein
MNKGTCRLCLRETELLSESHIIPNFLYKEIFDERHKLDKVKAENPPKLISRPSSGEYEGGILCKACDNDVIGKFESYAKKVLFGGIPLKVERIRNEHGVEFITFWGIDYAPFKLFLLSILWRASISTRDFFSEIKLGSHENHIRNMIINRDAKGKYDYPILLFTHRNNKAFPVEYIESPHKIHLFGKISYVFNITGIYYIFVISVKKIVDPLMDFALDVGNGVSLFHYPKGRIPKVFRRIR